jgi:hypothetical protein
MSQGDDPNLEDVLQHLRTTKAKAESLARKKGLEAGREWILSKRADAPMLQRLEQFYRSARFSDTTFEAEVEKDNINHFVLYAEISGKDDEEIADEEFDQFWLQASKSRADHRDPVFLIAFVDGALGLWDELREKL